MKTDRLLAAVLALQGLTLLGQWTDRPMNAPGSSAAYGQIPNAGDQRQRLVDATALQAEELRGVNARLDKLIALLSGGDLQVTVKPADDAKGAK